MIAGLYTSAAGMLGQIEQQDIISNNLANCNTAGFKRVRVGFSAFDLEMANARRLRSSNSQGSRHTIPVHHSMQDWRQGEMADTASLTNLAINGPGFFVVGSNQGQRLTRDGSFQLDESGRLVTSSGEPALGMKGPITVTGQSFEVDANGDVKVDGVVVDTLRIEMPANAPAGSVRGRIEQGRIESSNVSAIQETTGMIAAVRAYEANQRAIQAIDQTLDKIINQVSR